MTTIKQDPAHDISAPRSWAHSAEPRGAEQLDDFTGTARAQLLERILPSEVVAVETRVDLVETERFSAEQRAVRRAVEKRRREFVTGRACAHAALRRLGVPAAAIGVGAHGEPLWPAGVRGSITHCQGYRACAVSRAPELLSIGIDAEPHGPLSPAVRLAVINPRERPGTGGPRDGIHLDRVLFSAKEAIYKAWFPLVGTRLGFEDVDVSIDLADGTFLGRVLVPAPVVAGRRLAELSGRWEVDDGIVVTAVVV